MLFYTLSILNIIKRMITSNPLLSGILSLSVKENGFTASEKTSKKNPELLI